MNTYKHTQTGWVMIVSFGAAILFLIITGSCNGLLSSRLLAAILMLALFVFATLTVSVEKESITAVFGIGLIRMRIKINDIASLAIVRNKWWYGFGIHGFWGKGWLLNVSGLNAVEIRTNRGMIYRIGTDQSQELHDAIRRMLTTI